VITARRRWTLSTPRVESPKRRVPVRAVSGDRSEKTKFPRLCRYVVIPPNWPPVTFSTWPCT